MGRTQRRPTRRPGRRRAIVKRTVAGSESRWETRVPRGTPRAATDPPRRKGRNVAGAKRRPNPRGAVLSGPGGKGVPPPRPEARACR